MSVEGPWRSAVSTAFFMLGLIVGPALAQEAAPADTDGTGESAGASPAGADGFVPAGTPIEIRIDEAVNSKTHKTGDWFAISLSQPIMLGPHILVPAGTPGRGQVVHAAKSGWGGKAGELILAARYLDHAGGRIGLRSLKLGAIGANNETLALATSIAGGVVAMPLVFALNGKNADVPAGALAIARLVQPLADTVDAAPRTPDIESTEAAKDQQP